MYSPARSQADTAAIRSDPQPVPQPPRDTAGTLGARGPPKGAPRRS